MQHKEQATVKDYAIKNVHKVHRAPREPEITINSIKESFKDVTSLVEEVLTNFYEAKQDLLEENERLDEARDRLMTENLSLMRQLTDIICQPEEFTLQYSYRFNGVQNTMFVSKSGNGLSVYEDKFNWYQLSVTMNMFREKATFIPEGKFIISKDGLVIATIPSKM